MRRLFSSKKGSVLIMTVFFVVALMTVIPGTMLQMSRENREIQRYVDQVPLSFVADGLQERAVRLLSDWVLTNDNFPVPAGVCTAGSGDCAITASDDTLTPNQSVNEFLESWYGGFKSSHAGDAPILDAINVTSVEVYESGYHGDSQKRKYKVIVNFQQVATAYQMKIEQEFVITSARLFDFSVFYNDDLEITAGPDFTLEGPIFSNKDVYMMNHMGSTLKLARAPDFSETGREPYVMNAGGDIYFYFKRATARNYLLDNSTYFDAAPAYYKTAPVVAYVTPEGVIESGPAELFAHAIQGNVNPKLIKPPFAYYFKNSAKLGSPVDGWAGAWQLTGPNTIKVENSPSAFPDLIPPRSTIQFAFTWHPTGENEYLFYSPASPYNSNAISVSTAFSASDTSASKPLVNPSWTSSPFYTSGMVKNKVSQKSIPIGDPSHLHGTHAVIEPLTDIFPPSHPGSAFEVGPGKECASATTPACLDTAEIKKQKFQQKAIESGLNLYVDLLNLGMNGGISNDLKALVDNGIVPNITSHQFGSFTYWTVDSTLYDYRLGVRGTVLDIDIGKLVNKLTDPTFLGGRFFNNTSGILIYVHTYPMRADGGFFNAQDSAKPRFVRLVNATTLPEHGLTVVSNGRVFIQGDYNTYVYSGKTAPPPAAVISDSFVVLSKQWSNGYNQNISTGDRVVTQDVTVNTALATGYLPSELTKKYNCNADMSNCFAKRDFSGNTGVLGVPTSSGELKAFSANWSCGDNSWQNGKYGVLANCTYYEDPAGSGLFYLNPKSDVYQSAIATGAPGTLPACEPADTDSNPANDCDNMTIRVPIYADPNSPTFHTLNDTAIRPFYGVAFLTLHLRSVCTTGQCWFTLYDYTCADGSKPTRECLAGHEEGGGEGEPVFVCDSWGDYKCPAPDGPLAQWSVVKTVQLAPSINYDSTRGYEPLYEVHYSGGIENLINLQEKWTDRTLQFSGTLSALWFARELRVGSVKKYFNESYYNSPERVFTYNSDLRDNPPPAVPSIFSVDRTSWKIKSP